MRQEKPGYQRVHIAILSEYLHNTEPDNTYTMCQLCDESPKPTDNCSESCGPMHVWVDNLSFVKIRLDRA